MRAPQITSPYAPDLARVRVWIEQRISALAFVELVAAILALITRMAELNGELVKQLAHLTRRRPRSETLDRVQRQMTLPFGSAGAEPKPAPAATEKTRTSRRGRHPGRARPSPMLDRTLVPNPVPAAMRVCPLCGAKMTTVAHRACEILDVIPAKVLVVVRLDETVACPNDDTIVTAEPPPQIVARGKLSDTLIVEALCDKYIEHQPIERQCARFSRAGADIAPQTLGRSVSACIDLLAPVASLIDVQTRGPGYLGTDATALRILDPDASLGVRNGAVWCWTNARWISFFYSPSGDADSVRRFLGDPRGRIVQCDGTSVTSFLEREGGKRPGCWSHGRRGLVVAARLGDSIALEGVRIIARLFVVERQAALAGDTADERRARRRETSRPIVDELRVWLDDKRDLIPPKTPLGNALGYLHRQWKRLTLFLDDGNIELTNNRRERELRRLVLGRKNWLFAWLDTGGERTAHVLSIVASCIAHDVNPRAYLHLVTRLIVHGWPNAKLRELLPDRVLVAHPELYVGEPSELSASPDAPALTT